MTEEVTLWQENLRDCLYVPRLHD